MVTIVDPKPHYSIVKQAVCRNCGVTLEYVPAEVQSAKHYDYTGDCDIVKYIKCPQCGHDVTVTYN